MIMKQTNWWKQVRRIGRWIIPVAVWDLMKARYSLPDNVQDNPDEKSSPILLPENQKLHKLHKGKRCFILGTGPSVKTQNLSPLKSEICFALNTFYLHPQYAEITPEYHVFSGLANHPHISSEVGWEYLQELEMKTGNATLFLNLDDKLFIQENDLFKKRDLFYFCNAHNWELLDELGIDLTRTIYAGLNVAVTTIQLAIYMGFEQIYLLGLDHNWLFNKPEDGHFYAMDEGIIEKNYAIRYRQSRNMRSAFEGHARLWLQYEKLNILAEKENISIYNATRGGWLDVFKRVEYDSLVTA